MSAPKEDYRTNRADYVIAARHARATTEDKLARKEKSLFLKDRRSARLAANPSESSPEAKARPRGSFRPQPS